MYSDQNVLFLIFWGLLFAAGIGRAVWVLMRDEWDQQKWAACANSASVGLISGGVLIHLLTLTQDTVGWTVFGVGVFLGFLGMILTTRRGYEIISTWVAGIVR